YTRGRKSRVGKTEGAGALHRVILEARLEKRAILPNFNVDIRDPKFLIGLRLTESNLRFRNFGFEMGFCPISQFPLLITQLCCCPLRGGECILLLLCFFRSFCVLHASSTEGILQPIIRLMTGVFPERPRDLLYRYFSRPRPGPHPRIFHRELVKNRVLISAREPFNHV